MGITVHAALNHLLTAVTGARLHESQPKFPVHIRAELQAFSRYAEDVCGLASATLVSRQQWIGRFLTYLYSNVGIDLPRVQPSDIQHFFTAECQAYRPGTAQVVASAVRSYLRFRAVQHAENVESLLAAVPTAAHWRLAALPNYLDEEELTRLMAGFDRTRPQQQRDYAMVRCLLDLGLRSCEVAALRLDDIDWRSGTIAIRVGKAHRKDLLPLPYDTGQAIAEYLRRCRPASASRSVFVRHRAPLGPPVTTSVVRSAIRQAAVRSGLVGRLCGPHRLRHSAATRMLHGGATLKEIADILRNGSLDTTAIYAKVDLPRLAALAQPWPGEAE